MSFSTESVATAHFRAWHSIATQQAAKLLTMLPLGKLSNLPYGSHLVSVLESAPQTNGFILFGSTFFSENLLQYVRSKNKTAREFLQNNPVALLCVKMAGTALTAGIVRISTNYASNRTFSTASVIPTMLVAAFTPLMSDAFHKLHTKTALTANKFV